MLRRILCVCALASGPAWAGSDPVEAPPVTPSARIAHMLDLGSNVSLVRTPEKALELADAMSDPEFLVTAMVMSANPEVWLKAMEQAGAANVPKNLAQIASPEMLTDWFYSSIDPQFQQAIVNRMLDPKKPQRWMQSMSDPRFYLPALAIMNPATPMQWMKVTADGRMIQPMQTWLDPKTYLNWMRLPMPAAPAPAAPDAKRGGDKIPATYWKPPQRY